MKEYVFVKFEHQHTVIENCEEWKTVAACLHKLHLECFFIVSDFGPMWESKDIEIKERYRGPSIHFNSEYTWWYNITGGYKLSDE